ncbi:MAG: YqaA family protein [Alphaproteobacteria bacterium]|jgi:membrane protein YqaA with SNARE-associated domain|nr:DedA family protein [Acetobacter sp.]OLA66952.1 MAG: cytochrome B [Acetobacter sp. 46_36]CDA18068.1 dedA family protein [Acetobacter sp. CAG:267]
MAFKDLTRRIYDHTLNLASRKNALTWLFVISFIESSFFPIPPDIMIIPMVLATPKEAYKIAGVATVASVLGGYFGYFIGVYGFELIARPLLEFYGYMKQFGEFENYYHEYGAWIVFGAGITPFPYKIITIASGVVRLDLVVFTIASVIARGMRFYFIAWLLKRFGDPMKVFIEKNLNLLSILFLLLLIGGFAAVKLL